MSHELKSYSGPSLLDKRVQDELKRYYRFVLSKLRGFPSGSCEEAASLIAKDFGIPRIDGYFMCDIHQERVGHSWNEAYWVTIDSTTHQFNSLLLPQNKVLPGLHIITPDQPLYLRYAR